MGIFEKARNITDTDLRVVVTGASDPAKALRRHILELEESQRELKSSQGFLDRQRQWLENSIERKLALAEEWDKRASAAVQGDRDDLARHAISRKNELLRSMSEDRRSLDDLSLRLEEVNTRLKNLRRSIARAREARAMLLEDPEFKVADAKLPEMPTDTDAESRGAGEADDAKRQETEEELERLKGKLRERP